MRNRWTLFIRRILPITCVILFALTGWLWKRSRHTADYCYQLRATPEQSVLRGFGSYEGALVFGSVSEVGQPPIAPGIQHGKLKLTTGAGGQSILKLKPSYKTGSLGFGLSAGSVSLNLPMAFLLPTFRYHVLYIPYYLFMILFAVPPARRLWLSRSALPTQMFRTRLNSKALLPA
jgi:hypothetical protein